MTMACLMRFFLNFGGEHKLSISISMPFEFGHCLNCLERSYILYPLLVLYTCSLISYIF